MTSSPYLFDPFIPEPSRIIFSKTAWEEFQSATEVFAGFPSMTKISGEWVPGHFYPNGIQIAGVELPVFVESESGFLLAADSVISAGTAIAMFAMVSGMPAAVVLASSRLIS